ncbi:MAG: hypothetical protein G01um101418_440 [Parcubacteria group bacterium Gr01-1014_18]|nr:MAG: hypothetical protein Greene041636_485 [Parcubacteria group bacterium Greene0416_36]TSC81027.1 MAG: hypothetical protein G01um101418_440 [Parcubacteria group bacterium Gr01-1014_18]TSC98949.1 MAG: hypothetical protein Greene101420_461 [Parcubacteria group bacterium Greene1014_20]TSD06759.1 MAG: signal peptidase II [Parcubacteria group bacterium Greene0714_2]
MLYWVLILSILIDQCIKWSVLGLDFTVTLSNLGPFTLEFTSFANYNLAFGIPLSSRLILFFNFLILAVICYLFFSHRIDNRPYRLSFVAILLGAATNLSDRLAHGYVVDYLAISWGSWRSSIINIADILIFCGVVSWIYRDWRGRNRY